MKINKKYLAGSAAALVLSVCAYELGLHQAQTVKENNRVSYIDGNQPSQKAETLTPDEVSKKEGINAEQIVMETIIITIMARFLMMLSSVKNC